MSKRFGGLVAVNEVDLLIPPASIIGLIGPNGAGKTTFFNMVTGLIRPDAGRIAFEGRSLVGLRPNAIVARGVARTFQSIRLFQQLTALDNVLVGRNCRLTASVPGVDLPPVRRRRARKRAPGSGPATCSTSSASGTRRDEIATNLSYGDQRRLEIAPRAGDRAAPPAARRALGGDEPAREPTTLTRAHRAAAARARRSRCC